MESPTHATFRDTVRLLCAALTGSLVVILLAVALVLDKPSGQPPVWSLAVVIGAAVAMTVLILRIGFRAPAIVPATPADEARLISTRSFQQLTLIRFLLADTVTLTSIAVALAVDHGGLAIGILGVAASILLIALFVWPGDRVVQRMQDSLEREGGQSYLADALDGPAPSRR